MSKTMEYIVWSDGENGVSGEYASSKLIAEKKKHRLQKKYGGTWYIRKNQ